jgi:hypothetical protein
MNLKKIALGALATWGFIILIKNVQDRIPGIPAFLKI